MQIEKNIKINARFIGKVHLLDAFGIKRYTLTKKVKQQMIR